MSIRWNSPGFWAAMKWDWAAIGPTGTPYEFESRPHVRETTWSCSRDIFSLYGLDITDLPDAADWQNSLIHRPKVWRVPDENTPVDAKVWCRDVVGARWYKRHWASNKRSFEDGMTSWITGDTTVWKMIVLADPDDLDTPPPMDYVPEAKP